MFSECYYIELLFYVMEHSPPLHVEDEIFTDDPMVYTLIMDHLLC